MDFCVDSNILIYIVNDLSPFHINTSKAILAISSRGDKLMVFPQNLVEFWAVATRPIAANGLGMTIAQTEHEIENFKNTFSILAEAPAIYPEWERLVVAHSVSGKNVHDTRIVAQMNVHGIVNLLTFNTKDFSRYTNINSVDPASV